MDESTSSERSGRPDRRVGHYEIVSEIGRGGMGVVYRARDLTLDRYVALKRPLTGSRDDAELRRRLLKEAKAAARLAHPHVVPVFEVLEEDDELWVAMELVEGLSLRDLLAASAPLRTADLLAHAEGLSSALAAAHERGIVHGDVSPGNIMVTPEGRALLADFGLARVARLASEASPTATRDSVTEASGRVAGTPHYMSPEQALGKRLDARSDLFSLGAVLYEMCTGRKAFPGQGGEALDALLNRDPQPVSRINHSLPPELDHVLEKALAKDLGARYQSAQELLADLTTVRRRVEHAESAATAEEPRRASGNATARRFWPWAVAAALGAALLGSAGGLPPGCRPRAPAERVRVGVLPYQDESGRPETAGWPDLVQALFVRELTGIEDLGVLDPLTVNGVLENTFGTRKPRRGPELLQALRVASPTVLVDGSITANAGGYRIRTHLVRVDSGEVSLTDEIAIREEALLAEAVARQAKLILGTLRGVAVAEDEDLAPWLVRRPANLEALKAFMLAAEYARRHEPGAGPHLDRALALDPDYIAPRLWMISGAVADGSHEEARRHLAHLRRIESTASPFEQALIAWAAALIADDHAAQARHLMLALQYSPDNNILLVTLAEARLRMRDLEGALDALGPALRIKWRYPNLYSLQGVCLLGLGRLPQARTALTDALAVTPVDAAVYGMLFALSVREGSDAKGEEYRQLYFNRARELGVPAGPAHEDLAAHLVRVGLHERAVATESAALAAGVDPAYPGHPLTDALFESASGDGCIEFCARAVRERPDLAGPRLLLGRIAEARGRVAEAVRYYEEYVALEAGSAAAAGARARLMVLRGRAGAREGS